MADFVIPNRPSKCTWHKGADPSNSPHPKIPTEPRLKIYPDVLRTIGDTPLIRLNKIPESEGIKCDILVKCEFFNPGGSTKDRIALRMVEDAERDGILKPGYTIIEPTSGNTGIGLAMVAAIKGYRCIIVMPEKMSNEKVDVMIALGAEMIRTPNTAGTQSPDGFLAVSQRLQREIPNSVILDQFCEWSIHLKNERLDSVHSLYLGSTSFGENHFPKNGSMTVLPDFSNRSNSLSHYDTTGVEIYEQCGGKVDVVVGGTGTGGTMTGISRKLKALCPSCKIVALDPDGSVQARPESLNKVPGKFWEVEGIGYDIIPTVLDHNSIDEWHKVGDEEALPMAKRLIKEEGLLVGGSSGAAVVVALRVAKNLKEGQKCIVILADGIRNYLSKFVADPWMEVRNFQPCPNLLNHWWWEHKVSQLNLDPAISIPPTTSCSSALNLMRKSGLNQLPIIAKDGTFEGLATLKEIMNALFAARIKSEYPVTKAIVTKCIKVKADTSLGLVSKALQIEGFAAVIKEHSTREEIVSIITPSDLLQYVTENNGDNACTKKST